MSMDQYLSRISRDVKAKNCDYLNEADETTKIIDLIRSLSQGSRDHDTSTKNDYHKILTKHGYEPHNNNPIGSGHTVTYLNPETHHRAVVYGQDIVGNKAVYHTIHSDSKAKHGIHFFNHKSLDNHLHIVHD